MIISFLLIFKGVLEKRFLKLCYDHTADISDFSSLLMQGVDPNIYHMVRAMLRQVHVAKYRIYHNVEVSTGFAHRGPQARGCVNRVETDTEWYNWLVPWTTWPWQRIHGLATTASAIKGSSACLATVQTIAAECCRSSPKLDIDDRNPTLFSVQS